MPAARPSPAQPHALHDEVASRALETQALDSTPPHHLMQRAGLSLAQLAMALAPHARLFWVACGPGHNGGDGLIAAKLLHQWGGRVWVTRAEAPAAAGSSVAWALQQCTEAGLQVQAHPPTEAWGLALDALFGLGARPGLDAAHASWLHAMRTSPAPLLCADVPSGLHAGTGAWSEDTAWLLRPPGSTHTLSLLTLKSGLYTGAGRDAAGQVWFDDLGTGSPAVPATATLLGPPPPRWVRHDSHKGHGGIVWVIGGGPGMAGAAWLAAQSALRRGAGRVQVQLLAPETHPVARPMALMTAPEFPQNADALTVVAGCGAGVSMRAALPRVLSVAPRLVLDADGLNALVDDVALQTLLRQRSARGRHTILTPHPLEAARLLDCSVQQVQSDRLQSARALASKFEAVVVLKGSGSLIAHPDGRLAINPTGHPRLATAGSGDVLAGWIGACLARGHDAWKAACHAVYEHGRQGERGPADEPLLADDQ